MSVSPDIQATFDYLVGLAQKALADNRSFAPFATTTLTGGERTHSRTDLAPAVSTPGEHISALITALRRQAQSGGVRAAGLVFDAAAPSDVQGGADAICVHAETAEGEAVQIFVAYTRGRSPVPVYAEPVIQDVPARIFAA